jgi:hypothetical protein
MKIAIFYDENKRQLPAASMGKQIFTHGSGQGRYDRIGIDRLLGSLSRNRTRDLQARLSKQKLP